MRRSVPRATDTRPRAPNANGKLTSAANALRSVEAAQNWLRTTTGMRLIFSLRESNRDPTFRSLLLNEVPINVVSQLASTRPSPEARVALKGLGLSRLPKDTCDIIRSVDALRFFASARARVTWKHRKWTNRAWARAMQTDLGKLDRLARRIARRAKTRLGPCTQDDAASLQNLEADGTPAGSLRQRISGPSLRLRAAFYSHAEALAALHTAWHASDWQEAAARPTPFLRGERSDRAFRAANGRGVIAYVRFLQLPTHPSTLAVAAVALHVDPPCREAHPADRWRKARNRNPD